MGRPRRPSARQILAANVRQGRERVNWSQEELGARAQISQTYVSQVESGQRAVSIDVVDRLAMAFGVEVAEILRRQ
jgi:transcriptional regulator with XRE-family HTH domain